MYSIEKEKKAKSRKASKCQPGVEQIQAHHELWLEITGQEARLNWQRHEQQPRDQGRRASY